MISTNPCRVWVFVTWQGTTVAQPSRLLAIFKPSNSLYTLAGKMPALRDGGWKIDPKTRSAAVSAASDIQSRKSFYTLAGKMPALRMVGGKYPKTRSAAVSAARGFKDKIGSINVRTTEI